MDYIIVLTFFFSLVSTYISISIWMVLIKKNVGKTYKEKGWETVSPGVMRNGHHVLVGSSNTLHKNFKKNK